MKYFKLINIFAFVSFGALCNNVKITPNIPQNTVISSGHQLENDQLKVSVDLNGNLITNIVMNQFDNNYGEKESLFNSAGEFISIRATLAKNPNPWVYKSKTKDAVVFFQKSYGDEEDSVTYNTKTIYLKDNHIFVQYNITENDRVLNNITISQEGNNTGGFFMDSKKAGLINLKNQKYYPSWFSSKTEQYQNFVFNHEEEICGFKTPNNFLIILPYSGNQGTMNYIATRDQTMLSSNYESFENVFRQKIIIIPNKSKYLEKYNYNNMNHFGFFNIILKPFFLMGEKIFDHFEDKLLAWTLFVGSFLLFLGVLILLQTREKIKAKNIETILIQKLSTNSSSMNIALEIFKEKKYFLLLTILITILIFNFSLVVVPSMFDIKEVALGHIKNFSLPEPFGLLQVMNIDFLPEFLLKIGFWKLMLILSFIFSSPGEEKEKSSPGFFMILFSLQFSSWFVSGGQIVTYVVLRYVTQQMTTFFDFIYTHQSKNPKDPSYTYI